MQKAIEELQSIIADYGFQLKSIKENAWSYKPDPSKWSKKEILGHLIDSAQTNIRRFIISQYEDEPAIRYSQDDWVRLSNYQNYNTDDLISLWTLLNKHICIILKNTSVETSQRLCNSGELHSIQWLARDYNKHLLHHLHHLLELEPISYP